jgi:hypothetical protein
MTRTVRILPEALVAALRVNASDATIVVETTNPRAVTLKGSFDYYGICEMLNAPRDLEDALELLGVDHEVSEDRSLIDIFATIDDRRVALALTDPELAGSDLEFLDTFAAREIFLVNVGMNYEPDVDNTVAIRDDRESADKLAEILLDRKSLNGREFDWVKVIKKRVGALPDYAL